MQRVVQGSAVLLAFGLTLLACGHEEAPLSEEALAQQGAALELSSGVGIAAVVPKLPPKVRLTSWSRRTLWPLSQVTAVNIVGRSPRTPGVTRFYGVDPRTTTFTYVYELPNSEMSAFMANLFDDYTAIAPTKGGGSSDAGTTSSLLSNGPIDDEGGPGGEDPFLNVMLMRIAKAQANAVK